MRSCFRSVEPFFDRSYGIELYDVTDVDLLMNEAAADDLFQLADVQFLVPDDYILSAYRTAGESGRVYACR